MVSNKNHIFGGDDMARVDATCEKILKLGKKQKLDAIIKYSNDNDDVIRTYAAQAL